MSLATIRRRFTLAIMSVLLLTMLPPLNILPRTAFAQSSSVTLNIYQGPPGTQVTATGSNWVAGDTIHVLWGGTNGQDIKQGTVDSAGNFTIVFTVPSDAEQGVYTVVFWDEQQRDFQVPPNPFTVYVTAEAVISALSRRSERIAHITISTCCCVAIAQPFTVLMALETCQTGAR